MLKGTFPSIIYEEEKYKNIIDKAKKNVMQYLEKPESFFIKQNINVNGSIIEGKKLKKDLPKKTISFNEDVKRFKIALKEYYRKNKTSNKTLVSITDTIMHFFSESKYNNMGVFKPNFTPKDESEYNTLIFEKKKI